MDDKIPWENVERVYVIPYEYVSDQKSVTIIKDPLGCPKWDEFMIDSDLFNNTYHNMEIYTNYFRKK